MDPDFSFAELGATSSTILTFSEYSPHHSSSRTLAHPLGFPFGGYLRHMLRSLYLQVLQVIEAFQVGLLELLVELEPRRVEASAPVPLEEVAAAALG